MLTPRIAQTIEDYLRSQLANINFDEICWSDYDNSCADFMKENLLDCYSVRAGESKCVLFFQKISNLGYCVKIPFLGYEDEDENGELYRSNYRYANYIFRAWNDYREKTSSWDYCDVEAFISNKAKEWHVDNFFAHTYYLCEINHHPIYVSELADSTMESNCDYYKSLTYNDSYNKGLELKFENYCVIDNYSLGFFVDNYGEEAVKRFLSFLDRFNIGDLYENNIGFRNGFIKLIDYSDFND